MTPLANHPIKYAAINVSSGTTAVVAAVTGKKLRVLEYGYTVGGAGAVTWKSATTALTGVMPHNAAGEGIERPFNPAGYFETVAGEALNLTTTMDADGSLIYQEIG